MGTNRKGEESSPSQKSGQALSQTSHHSGPGGNGQPAGSQQKIIQEMKRSGTLLRGQGIYAQTDRPVLLVALTVSEAAHLKAIVRTEDPQAFVIVMPAQEVLGRGFQPLKENK